MELNSSNPQAPPQGLPSPQLKQRPVAVPDLRRIEDLITHLVVHIDELLNKAVNDILHHPRFQKLEADWRAVSYLCHEKGRYTNKRKLKIKLLDVSVPTLAKDLGKVLDYEQSEIYKKVYEGEYDRPGGEPFALLIGSYKIQLTRRAGMISDVEVLKLMGKIAAASFAPFICNTKAEFFGIDSFTGLHPNLKLKDLLKQREYGEWNNLRKEAESRYLGCVIPEVLIRKRYQRNLYNNKLLFEETIDHERQRLWANGCFAFAAVTMRAFAEYGWYVTIRGLKYDKVGGGMVDGLPYEENPDLVIKIPPISAWIQERQARALEACGFIPITIIKHTPFLLFQSNYSIFEVKEQDSTSNKLAGMLQYILCVSRFAHYIKVISRQKIGKFLSEEECEQYLEKWMRQYVSASQSTSMELKAKYPLRAAQIKVAAKRNSPGSFECQMMIEPHYQLDGIESKISFTTEIKNSD